MARPANYLDLWRRMNRVVDAYTGRGRTEEADYCMVDFFMSFESIEELERHVQAAEEAAREHGVLDS